jgi:hypothetical protein
MSGTSTIAGCEAGIAAGAGSAAAAQHAAANQSPLPTTKMEERRVSIVLSGEHPCVLTATARVRVRAATEVTAGKHARRHADGQYLDTAPLAD